MQLRDVVQVVTFDTPQDRLQIAPPNVPCQPVAFVNAEGGMELGAYSLEIKSVSGEDTLFLSTKVSRWFVVDPVQEYRGLLVGLPNIYTVNIDWGDGFVDRPNFPFDQPTPHEYPYAGDWLITATVELQLPGYPQHLATAYPTATYTFRARE